VPTALLGHHGTAFAFGASAPIILERRKQPETCAHCGAHAYSVCGAIDTDDLGPLAALAVVTEVEAGRTFIDEGDPAESFFNITSGTARLYKMLPDGRRQITGFAGPGHFLGLAASSVYAFSAEAIDAVRFCRLSRARLRKLMVEFPKLERRLLEVAANELVAAQEQMLLLGRKTARERLASFLIIQSRLRPPTTMHRPGPMQTGSAATCAGRGARITLAMTRGDIADYLGLTIETVSRTLTRLRSEGMIGVPNTNDVVILNCGALEKLAGGVA